MIRVSWETKEELNSLKVVPREAIGDVVKRILQENKTLHTEKSALLKQIRNFQPSPGSLMPVSVPILSDVPMKFNDPSA